MSLSQCQKLTINVVCCLFSAFAFIFVIQGLAYPEVFSSKQTVNGTEIKVRLGICEICTKTGDNEICHSTLQGQNDGEQCISPYDSECNKYFVSMKVAFFFFIVGGAINLSQIITFGAAAYNSRFPNISLINLFGTGIIFVMYTIAFPVAVGPTGEYVDYINANNASINLTWGMSAGTLVLSWGLELLLLLAAVVVWYMEVMEVTEVMEGIVECCSEVDACTLGVCSEVDKIDSTTRACC